jgi:hypothetical protein
VKADIDTVTGKCRRDRVDGYLGLDVAAVALCLVRAVGGDWTDPFAESTP